MNNQTAIQPIPEQIAMCAYLIWEKEGRPQGRHESHWLQAENQLKTDQADGAAVRRRPETAATAEQPRPKRGNNSKRLEVVAS